MKKGFTLIEILAVIVIVGIVAAIGTYSVTKVMARSKEKSLNIELANVKKAADIYIAGHSISEGKTKFDLLNSADPMAKYINLGDDPWGNPYTQAFVLVNKSGKEVTVHTALGVDTRGCYIAYEKEIGNSSNCEIITDVLSLDLDAADAARISATGSDSLFFLSRGTNEGKTSYNINPLINDGNTGVVLQKSSDIIFEYAGFGFEPVKFNPTWKYRITTEVFVPTDSTSLELVASAWNNYMGRSYPISLTKTGTYSTPADYQTMVIPNDGQWHTVHADGYFYNITEDRDYHHFQLRDKKIYIGDWITVDRYYIRGIKISTVD